ncbi:MAG TPA: hypothetical protein VGQ12_11025 [Candidatus Angelobacter sp.]|jgi:hypothetical protein|nr:hypothetical protein [Candidatus Angelobacter sp.]
MAIKHANQLERVRYWEGQLLSSGDLETQMRVVAELRRLHNRAVHGAYGIAIGLQASDIVNGALPLSCGLAYDCSGRELIVPISTSVALPSSFSTPLLLIISYDAESQLSRLSWLPENSLKPANVVAVARVKPGSPPQLDHDYRPVVARPLARPRIAAGATVPGDTAWELWEENGISIGVQSEVDTSAAGFTTTPNYFAEVEAGNSAAEFLPAWFASIAAPKPDSFTLRLFMRRIARESFDIVDAKSRAAATPAVGGPVTLEVGNVFARYDTISRLLPMAELACTVTALSGTTATLDSPLSPFSGSKDVAFGNRPRVTTVASVPEAAGPLVTVDQPGNFQVGDVIVKTSPSLVAQATKVNDIDDTGDLELATSITGLAKDDTLGVAQQSTAVTNVSGNIVTVQNPQLFHERDIVVCIETLQATRVQKISGSQLTLDVMIAAQTNNIAPVQDAATVQAVEDEPQETKIPVAESKFFRAGDLVAKVLPGGLFSAPVRVQSVQSKSNAKSLTLKTMIAGLSVNDQIGAADFRVRATVLNVSNNTVTVADASLFPGNSYVARLDDTYTATASALVKFSSGSRVDLNAAIPGLKSGDILALCSFPVTASVQSVGTDGIIEVEPAGVLQAGDLVACDTRAALALVAAASGPSVQLAGSINGLAVNDKLSVVTMSGTVSVTPGGNKKVTLEPANRVRFNDFLGDITGWREPNLLASHAQVISATGTSVQVSGQLDGLMVHDTVGLATLSGAGGSLLLLRLNTLPNLTPGDEALLVGLDRLQGVSESMFSIVAWIYAPGNFVILFVEAPATHFNVRPEDLSASVLFVRGSPLRLVKNLNLYVSWLACQAPEPMPRPCPDDTPADGPCGSVQQS